MSDERPPPPKLTPRPYQNGTEQEPPSGVFNIKTGHTRRRVAKWGAVLTAVTALLTPIANAIALRISRPAGDQTARELGELYDLRKSLFRDGGQ